MILDQCWREVSKKGDSTLKDTNNHPFPESTSFRMTLESTIQRDDMCARVDVGAEVLVMPRAVGIINHKVALLSQWW
jgi:hypothetical protein